MTALGWIGDAGARGASRALILLPSLGTTSRIFDELVDGLALKHPDLAIVRANLPGHGNAPLSSHTSIEDLSAEVVHVMAGMRSSSVVVAGVSMGGAIAFEVARRLPPSLSGFAMINSALRFGDRESWRALTDSVGQSGMEGARQDAVDVWFSPAFVASDRARAVFDDLAGIDPTSYLACCRALAGYSGASVPAPSVPAVLIGTADDPAVPVLGLRTLARELPNADYAELPLGRHLSLVEHSPTVQEVLTHMLIEKRAR